LNNKRTVLRSFPVIAFAAVLIPAAAMAEVSAGEKIVGEVCSSCHGSGLLGAPKIGDNAAWSARFKKAGSVNALTETAEHGKGNMPPRGGESSLTDSEVQSAIQFMLGKSGVSY
jgi:cytochrome c5